MMPDIPNVPGVPALSGYSSELPTLLFADAAAALLSFLAPNTWGIFLDGIPVLLYDTQVNFEYLQDWKVSTYPVEQGAFQSYDKVQLPSEIRVRLAAGASVFNRQAMLDSIDLQMSTTLTYDIVTPEKVYLNYNFTHRSYSKEAANVGLVEIDLMFVEIMETATAQFQDTLDPTASGQVGLGNVSAPPTDPGVANNVGPVT